MFEVRFEGKMTALIPAWVLEAVSGVHPFGHQLAAYDLFRKRGYSNQTLGRISAQEVRVVECSKIPNQIGEIPQIEVVTVALNGETTSSKNGSKWYVKLVQQFTVRKEFYHTEHEIGMYISDQLSQVTEHTFKIYDNNGNLLYEGK